jgi:MFS superfamily sulfate permease-like transporter
MKLREQFSAYFSQDLRAGLVVFLVALPLCLGIALASGAPLFAGIITGIVGGILTGLLSGSELSVSGPAAGLTVIVLTAISTLGSFDAFLVSVMIAGGIQLLLGLARAGIVGYYFPSSVIKGMLAAIGIILIIKQIPHAWGYDADTMGDQAYIQKDGENSFSELIHMLSFWVPGALLISGLSLAILLLWDRKPIKGSALGRYVPGALVAVLLGTAVNELLGLLMPIWQLQSSHLVELPVAGSLAGAAALLRLPDWSAFGRPEAWMQGGIIAIVASMETLLSLEATDKLDPEKRVSRPNRELRAQGIGNLVAGLLGGLPMTAVIVRSSANIAAGAKSRWSAVYHGILLLLCVLLIPRVLNRIPLASLAAVLLVVGYKLTRVSLFRGMYKLGWDQFLPFIVTVLAIVFSDLLKGVAVGMAVAVFFILRNNYKNPYYYRREEHHEGGERISIELAQEVSFLNKANVLMTLNALPENSRVLIDASGSRMIDYDVLEIIEDFRINAQSKGIILEIKGLDLHKTHAAPAAH